MLLTSYSFLFFFLPISFFGYFLFFEKNLKSKIIYIGIISAYFYFLDNGLLLLILIFLAFITKIQIEKKIFSNFFYVSLSLTPLLFSNIHIYSSHFLVLKRLFLLKIIFQLDYHFLLFKQLHIILTKIDYKKMNRLLKFLLS